MKTTRTPLARLAAASVGPLLVAASVLPAAAQQTMPAQPLGSALTKPVPTGPLTLQQAVDFALSNNLTVRQTELNARQQEAIQRLNRAALLPTAGLNATQNFNFGTNRDPFTNQFQQLNVRSNNFSASAQATLFAGFQLRNTVKQGVLQTQAAQADIEKARNDLSLNVASSYLQLLLAQELIRASEARMATVQAQVSRSEKLLKAGSVAEGNVLDSRAQLAGEESTLVTAQNQRDLARLTLLQLLNLDPATPAAASFEIITPALPDPASFEAEGRLPDPNETYEQARQRQPEVRAAELRVQSAQRGIEIARGAYYPRLTVSGGVQTGFTSARSQQILNPEKFQTVPVLQASPTTPGQYLPTSFVLLQPAFDKLEYRFIDQLRDNRGEFLQFNLNIPILNGLQSRVGEQRARVSLAQSELQADQVRVQLRQTIQQSYADALAAQRRYAASARQVEALTTSFRNAEIRFNNGLLNGTDFNIARNNLTAAESDMIQAKYQFIFRRKVLDFYQGKPLAL
ncbi:outer membrane protein [Hymenobacter daecheongensis DSM 21074]|uniref:Outer membrane protein n=1 Tax=Hymenobacter daecheongensis DSM 21074 TaxID=1121955 RepID=A0A1M6JXM7_9BACT|nr:TolC family protein [Hymenobacter daecheongensis]SHJ51454.1 outer membrane protein [Hymenobacter daecheongensis DSM 21074]